jgi:serine/threonine protein kinase
MHRDIRAENILITFHKTAKLSNFKLSDRYLSPFLFDPTRKYEQTRYCAPELLQNIRSYGYGQRCEVYSFGILLWEIAEERFPYQDENKVSVIIDQVCNMYREQFSKNSPMPEKYKQLEAEGTVCESKYLKLIKK